MFTRRTIGKVVLGSAISAALAAKSASAQTAKWSTGNEKPRVPLPDGAVDCHHHIYDAHFPADPKATLRPADALIADYQGLKARLGIARHVIIQPSTYGTDNRLLVESLKTFGPSARGVAVVRDDVPLDDLKEMHAAGVRGARFNLNLPDGVPIEMMQPLAKRIAELGWHIQVVAGPDRVVSYKEILNTLPVPVVFDHFGQVPAVAHPAFDVIAKLLERGAAFVKLSGAYTFSKVGPPTYGDAAEVGLAYVKLAPDRLVWGSDWPHPTAAENAKPDDALLVDLVSQWSGSDAVRRKIFVENPIKLYGF